MQLDPGKTELSSSAGAQGNRRPFLVGQGPCVPTRTTHCASVCAYRGSVAARGIQLQLEQGEPALKKPLSSAAGLGVPMLCVPSQLLLGHGPQRWVWGQHWGGAPFGGPQGVQRTLSSHGFFFGALCSVCEGKSCYFGTFRHPHIISQKVQTLLGSARQRQWALHPSDSASHGKFLAEQHCSVWGDTA